MISKKAQGGPGLGTIIAVGVMLVAAILIVLYLLDVSNTVGDFTKITPSALSAKAEICKGLSSSQVAYCEFTEVEKDKYINCAYPNTAPGGADFRAEIDQVVTNTPPCVTDRLDYCKDKLLVDNPSFKGSVNGLNCNSQEISGD